MGCVTNNSPHTKQPELQTPYIENLKRLPEYIEPHFLIFADCNLDQPILKQISKQFPLVPLFKNLKELTQFTDDYMSNHLLVISNNDTYIKEPLPNFAAFQSIAFSHNQPINQYQNILEKLKALYGYRFFGLFVSEITKIKSYFSNASQPRSLLFCNHDQGLINRFLANTTFLLQNDQPPLQTFKEYLQEQGVLGTNLTRAIDKQLIEKNTKIGSLLVDQIADKNICLLGALQLLKKTSNPGILAHTAWLYKKLHNHIRISYTGFLKSPNRKKLFFVVEPSQIETPLLQRDQNFMVSTFWIGFTDKEDALTKKKKSPKNYLFIVNLPQILIQNSVDIDFGFCEYEGCAIFSVGTFFRIDQVSHQQKQITVTSGVLGSQYNYRKQQNRYMEKAKHQNKCMMRLIDYIKMQKHRLKDQIYLLLHLQYYHTFKDIVETTINPEKSQEEQLQSKNQTLSPNKTKIFSTAPTTTSSVPNSVILPTATQVVTISTALREYLADAYAGIGYVEQAEKIYNQMENRQRSLLKQIYMFDKWNKEDRLTEILQRLPQLSIKDKTSLNFQQIAQMSFNAVYLATRNISKQAKQAKQKADCFKQLDSQFKTQFINTGDLHQDESITAFPLYSIIMNNASRVAKMVGNRSDAQIWQKESSIYWAFFDGTHIQWLP